MSFPGPVLVEACVDTALSARRAVAGGARRLELCSGLVEGGLTPSIGLMQVLKEEISTPIHVLIRPRGGDFLYETDEVATMLADIAEAKRLGMAGVVTGALPAKPKRARWASGGRGYSWGNRTRPMNTPGARPASGGSGR